jgi:hypothetical protein
MFFRSLFTLCLGWLLVSQQAFAHHSFAASFTTDEITREGVVTKYIFKNPHVIIHMDVIDQQGKSVSWMVEGQAATGYRKLGWDKTLLNVGEYVRVTGRAGRNNKPMISMEQLNVLNPVNGVVIRSPAMDLDDVPQQLVSKKILPLAKTLADGRPNLSGVWVRDREAGGGFRAHTAPPYNEKGGAIQKGFDPADDPQVACESPGLVRQAAFTPHPVRITQFDDRVLFEYEEYAGRRVVYFDDRAIRQSGNERTKFGRSIARYDGNKLIIETTHLSANPTDTHGYWLSDQQATVETYQRSDVEGENPMVEMKIAINDPGYLTEPWSMRWEKGLVEDYEFIGVECYKPL